MDWFDKRLEVAVPAGWSATETLTATGPDGSTVIAECGPVAPGVTVEAYLATQRQEATRHLANLVDSGVDGTRGYPSDGLAWLTWTFTGALTGTASTTRVQRCAVSGGRAWRITGTPGAGTSPDLDSGSDVASVFAQILVRPRPWAGQGWLPRTIDLIAPASWTVTEAVHIASADHALTLTVRSEQVAPTVSTADFAAARAHRAVAGEGLQQHGFGDWMRPDHRRIPLGEYTRGGPDGVRQFRGWYAGAGRGYVATATMPDRLAATRRETLLWVILNGFLIRSWPPELFGQP